MAITTTSTISPAVQAYYDKQFLLTAKPTLIYYQLGQKKVLPAGNGKTVYFSRYMPLAIRTTPLTETSDGGITAGSGKALYTQEISATVAEYGDYVEIAEIASKTSIDKGIKEKVAIVSQQASDTIEEIIKLNVGTGFQRMRADGDATYQVDTIADGTFGSTTTLIASSLTQLDDFWNGGYVTFTNPADKLYGITVQVSDFEAATDTLTVATLPTAPTAISTFRLVVGTGIAAGDVLSTTVIKKALRELKKNKALPFADGKYVCVLDPDIEYDFMSDTDWKGVATYQNAKALYNGEIGTWLGVRFVSATSIYRETVAGVYDAAGAVHVATLMGREAFGVVDLEGDKKKIIIKDAKDLGQPLEMSSTVGWKVGFASKVLNGCFGINILCGVSA